MEFNSGFKGLITLMSNGHSRSTHLKNVAVLVAAS